MGRMHAPGKGISSSAIVSTFLVLFIYFYGIYKLSSSHTEDLSHHGKSNLLKKSRTSSTSSPRRVTSHHSSVSTSEIPTVLVNLTTWLDPRSSVFSSPWELPQNFQKISTSWSRNSSILSRDLDMFFDRTKWYWIDWYFYWTWKSVLLAWESIWKETERTRTVNSVWFLSNPESTVSPDTTVLRVLSHQPSSTNLPPLLHSLHK